ncbi:MAG: class I SAM-dependent methyltransferase [Chitinophagales bacterium]|nr:class I SAM-dependent methyltransferase [Chitinophagales bacterium]
MNYRKARLKVESIKRALTDEHHMDALMKSETEAAKRPIRTDIINFLLESTGVKETTYLEIGVRNPAHNFDKIRATRKYSVDPGVEFRENPVDFKLTSDEFFEQLRTGKVLTKDTRFDLVFVDGLHLADQTERDIRHALEFLAPGGYVVLHDCNPPTESHAREDYMYRASPALDFWSGTTWKGFFKYRKDPQVFACCVDSDWGVGIISQTVDLGPVSTVENPFYEYHVLNQFRKESLNLVSFEELKGRVIRQ